jgi:thioredoxin-related protein
MMKKLFFVLAIMTITLFAKAGEVEYFNKPWSEIKAKARNESRMIFIDCYTDWCGWCKTMDKETMTSPDIVKILNEYFIPVKMDMENGEGIKLAMKYHVTGFPSFLFFDPEGNYIYQIAGYQKPDEFKKLLKNVLSGAVTFRATGISNSIDEEYPDFYVKAFAGNGKRTFPKAEEVNNYLATQNDLASEVPWAVIARFPVGEKYNNYFFENIEVYRQNFGPVMVADKVNAVLGSMLDDAIKTKNDALFNKVLSLIERYVKEDQSGAKIYTSLAYYKGIKNWPKYFESANMYINVNAYSNTDFVNTICWTLYENVADRQVLNTASEWMKKVTEAEPKYAYLDTYASLLYKAGRNNEAIEYAKLAIAAAKKDGTDSKPTEELLKKLNSKK